MIFLFGVCQALSAARPGAVFTENKGQWPSQVLFRALVPGGALFVEREALTYVIGKGGGRHDHHHGDETHEHEELQAHAWRVHFVGGHVSGTTGSATLPHYENYFLGKDPEKWGTTCLVHGEVLLEDVWPGINMRLTGEGGLKYELIVAAGADPSIARFRYEGQDGLLLQDGALHVLNSVATVVEQPPVSFNKTAHGQVEVRSAYQLDGDEMTFLLPDGFDPTVPLIIDPILSFSSYSGSTADNFGFTATYDDDGHLYGGGIVFGQGYPLTPGPLDGTFNGGQCDVGISKWSPDGSTLVWSTYLGGQAGDAPQSLVTNAANELFILGSTGSADMPVTAGCYQPDFAGGPAATPFSFFSLNNGADIFIARLNAAGNVLLGCTYFGGQGNDGVNLAANLNYNYGDVFRGEIILNDVGEPIISTSTSSAGMPTSPGAPQPAYGGGTQDAYLLRLDAGLTTMLWGTYLGGSGNDSGFGVQVSSTGEIFCSGGTSSANLPMAGTPMQPGPGGGVDGYVARYTASGDALLSTTYVGTPQYDQAFFVQLDIDDDVFIVGQTRGNYPMTPGKFGVPGSSQFIHKISNDLSTSLWSTRIGNGNGNEDISPSAFLVSYCRQIYFSGWGGNTNNTGTPNASTTIGLPTTPDAFKATSDGSDFYLMVLEPEAEGLNYATFFGGNGIGEHVDGGTSRFDKDGTVYQAVCAGCGNSNDFPTTPGAWSNTNNSTNCNLGVFKFDLSTVIAEITIEGPEVLCAGTTLEFQSTSSGGDTYHWNFGDGNEAFTQDATHEYAAPGTYTVTLEVTDSYECVLGDFVTTQVVVAPEVIASIEPIPAVCPGGQVQLVANPPDQVYEWSPPLGLTATDIQGPTASPGVNTTYQVVITGVCGVDSTTVDVIYAIPQISMLPDTAVCLGQSTTLGASGGSSYSWTPAETLSNTTVSNPVATPLQTTIYTVEMLTPDGCTLTGSTQVTVVFQPPTPTLVDAEICAGTAIQLHGPVADWYVWHGTGVDGVTIPSPVITPANSGNYHVECGNVCGTMTDSVFVDVVHVNALAWPDTIVCPGAEVRLHASGGVIYQWSPATWLDDPGSAEPLCIPHESVNYTITVVDDKGCSTQTELDLNVFELPEVDAGLDVFADWGVPIQLNGRGEGSFQWEPSELVDQPDVPSPFTSPEESTIYTLTITDANGCRATDTVMVVLNGSLFVPNTFTPNGDGINDHFGAWGKDIVRFRMAIFDRWGGTIFEANEMEQRWDGSFGGSECPGGVYIWRVDMEERTGTRRTLYGDVNLLR